MVDATKRCEGSGKEEFEKRRNCKGEMTGDRGKVTGRPNVGYYRHLK